MDGTVTELNGEHPGEAVTRPGPKIQGQASKKYDNQLNTRQQQQQHNRDHDNRNKQQQHNRDYDNHRQQQQQQERINETRQQQQQRQPKQDQQQKDRNEINGKQTQPQQQKQQQERGVGSNNKKSVNQSGNNVGIFIGRIPRTARVKDLKDVLGERDVKVVNLVWKGMKGFAFVYLELEAGCSEESLCGKLQGLKIGEAVLNIELDRKHHGQKQGAKSLSPDNELDVSGDQIPTLATNGNVDATLPEQVNGDDQVHVNEDKQQMSDGEKKSVDQVKLVEQQEAKYDKPEDQSNNPCPTNSNSSEDIPPVPLQTQSDDNKSASLNDKSLSVKANEKPCTEEPKIEEKLDLVSNNVNNQDGSSVKVEHTLCSDKPKVGELKADDLAVNGKVLDNKSEDKEEHILRQDDKESVTVVNTEVNAGKVTKEEHVLSLPVTSSGEPVIAEE